MITPESWPTAPLECHELLNRLTQQVEDLQAALDQAAKLHDQTVQEHDQTVEELRRQLELYRRYVFGPRRERLVDALDQGHLFELDAAVSIAAPPELSARELKTPARPRRSRMPDYDQLPQKRIEHDVPEADKVCTHCGETKVRIGEDEARVLEFIPARFELHIHVLPKYACSHCRDGVVAPETPPRPVSGCIAGAGVLAQVVVSKFAEHLPLYRLEDISTCYGLHLPRSTLCDWVRGVANLLKPLYEFQKELVLKGPVIWTDDTPVIVLGGEEPGSHKGRFWVYIGPTGFPYDVYDFTENRQRDGPARFLANYAGYLQADAFSGYDGIYTGSDGRIVEVACWAHARRKFFRGAVVVSRGSFADSGDDQAALRSRRPGSAARRRWSMRDASKGSGADPGAAAGRIRSTIIQAVAKVGPGASGDLRAEPMAGVVPLYAGRSADDRQ